MKLVITVIAQTWYPNKGYVGDCNTDQSEIPEGVMIGKYIDEKITELRRNHTAVTSVCYVIIP